MKSWVCATFLAVAWPVAALDFELKGVELGMTLSEIGRAWPGMPRHCEKPEKKTRAVSCMYLGPSERLGAQPHGLLPQLESFADTPTRYVELRLREGVLVYVAIALDRSAYGAAHRALSAKYAPPFTEDLGGAVWRIGDRVLAVRREHGAGAAVTLTTGREATLRAKEMDARAAADL